MSLAWHIGEGETIGETLPYEMLRFDICDTDRGVCIIDAGQLTYEWRHHNWDETITATTGDRKFTVRMSLVVAEDLYWKDTLSIAESRVPIPTNGPMPLEDKG